MNAYRCGRGDWWSPLPGSPTSLRFLIRVHDLPAMSRFIMRDEGVTALENALTHDMVDDVASSGDPLRAYPFFVKVALTDKSQMALVETPGHLLWLHRSRVQAAVEAAQRCVCVCACSGVFVCTKAQPWLHLVANACR